MIIPCYCLDHGFFKMTENCYLTAAKYGNVDEYIIVDDGSPYRTWTLTGDRVRMIRREENRGYPAAVNLGLREATGDVLIISNNDIVFTPHWFDELLKPLQRGYDISSIRITDSDGWTTEDKITEGDKFGSLWAMKRRVYETIGGFDESFGRGTFEDTDYRRRAIQAGFRIAKNHNGLVEHIARATFRVVDPEGDGFRRNREIFRRKWGTVE